MLLLGVVGVVLPGGRETDGRRAVIATDMAPRAIGPYSQAVRAGDFLFVSGQIPLDPSTGELVGGDAARQTHRVMESLREVVEAAGGTLAAVVRTTIYLTDLGEFGPVNEAYASYFPADPPARATVEVARLPKGAAVEISAVAWLGDR